MLKGIEYVLLGLGLMIGTIGNAQQFTEGVFEYGLISYKISKDSSDKRIISSVIKQLESTPDIKFHFTPTRLSVSTPDLIDKGLRVVIDLETYQEYNFATIAGVESFIINEEEPDLSRIIIINEEYGEGKKLSEKIHGLSCTEYSSDNGDESVKFITTNDILLPDSTKLNSMMTNNGFLLSMNTNTDLGLSFTMGIKSFSPVIDDHTLLSIDTMGMNNMTTLRNDFMQAIREKKK